MTLHIYVESNQSRVLISSLEFDVLNILSPIFDQFRQKTSVRLSEYDDAILESEHSALLAKLIRDYFGRVIRIKEILDLQEQLEKASVTNSCVYFSGE